MHWSKKIECGFPFKKKKNFSLDEPKEDRLKELDSEDLTATITENPDTPTRKLIEEFNISHTTVLREVKRIEKFSVIGKWVSSPWLQRIYNNVPIVASHGLHNFLKRLGDEKWMLYHNGKHSS